MNPNIV
jgi:hypothetical protein